MNDVRMSKERQSRDLWKGGVGGSSTLERDSGEGRSGRDGIDGKRRMD